MFSCVLQNVTALWANCLDARNGTVLIQSAWRSACKTIRKTLHRFPSGGYGNIHPKTASQPVDSWEPLHLIYFRDPEMVPQFQSLSISLSSSHLICISSSVLLTTAPETLILSTRNSLTRSSSFSLVVRLVSLSQRACSWRITRPVALPVATNLWRQRTWRTWSVKMQSSSHTLVSGLAVMSSEPLAQRRYCGLSLTEQLLCSTYQ